MPLEEDLRAHLAGGAGLTTIPIIHGNKPQQTPPPPFLIYTRIDTNYTHAIRGRASLEAPRFQFDAFANTFAQARSIAEALIVRLDGDANRGRLGGPTSTTDLRGARILNREEGWED